MTTSVQKDGEMHGACLLRAVSSSVHRSPIRRGSLGTQVYHISAAAGAVWATAPMLLLISVSAALSQRGYVTQGNAAQ